MAFDTKKLRELAISDQGMIFDPSTGYIFTSNDVSVTIIKALKEGKDNDEIKKLLMKKFEIDEKTVEKDLFDFIHQLMACGLVSDE
jgi:hypothetical protein